MFKTIYSVEEHAVYRGEIFSKSSNLYCVNYVRLPLFHDYYVCKGFFTPTFLQELAYQLPRKHRHPLHNKIMWTYRAARWVGMSHNINFLPSNFIQQIENKTWATTIADWDLIETTAPALLNIYVLDVFYLSIDSLLGVLNNIVPEPVTKKY